MSAAPRRTVDHRDRVAGRPAALDREAEQAVEEVEVVVEPPRTRPLLLRK